MKHSLDRSGSVQGFSDAIEECMNKHHPQGLLILSCDANGFTPEAVNPILHELPIPLCGGLFPGVIYGRELLMNGSLVVALPCRPRVQVLHGLSDARDLSTELEEMLVGEHGRTMFVLMDGLAMPVEPLVTSLFSAYGLSINYIGGGAGALNPESSYCLLTGEGLVSDAAVLAVLDMASGVGISHGLEKVSGPHRASDIRRNLIGSLDGQPACERFLELIRCLDPTLAEKKGFPISDQFCLGVSRIGGEKVVRDPFMADPDGSLHVVVEPGEGSFVDLLRATPDASIQAASRALKRAQEAYSGDRPYSSLFCFDCFGRWRLLGDRFPEALAALQDDRSTLLGALTVGGEIANSGTDFLDYYNRTCVVGVM